MTPKQLIEQLNNDNVKESLDLSKTINEATDSNKVGTDTGMKADTLDNITSLYGSLGALGNLFLTIPARPVFNSEFERSVLMPVSNPTSTQVKRGESPIQTSFQSVKLKQILGIHKSVDSIVREDLEDWYNASRLYPSTVDYAKAYNPLQAMLDNQLSQILTVELEQELWNGVRVDTNSKDAIIGIKTQHTLANTTTTTAMASNSTDKNKITGDSAVANFVDNAYNKVIYTQDNDGTGALAFLADVELRFNMIKLTTGYTKMDILVPMNTGATLAQIFRARFGTFRNVTPNEVISENNRIAELGGVFQVTPNIRIIDGGSKTSKEIMLVFGGKAGRDSYERYEYANTSGQPRGLTVVAQTREDAFLKELLEASNINYQESNGNLSIGAEALGLGLQWRGGVGVSSLGVNTLYTQCEFATTNNIATVMRPKFNSNLSNIQLY